VVPAYLLHHRLHAIQGAQQLHRLLRQAIQAFGRAHPHLQQTGSVCGSRCRASLDERFLRAHDSELVSLRVGQDSPGLSAGLADVDLAPRAHEGGQSPDRDPRRCWSGQRYTRFLSILGSVTGMKHMPTGGFSSAPMTTSFSRSDRTFQPSARVQNRPGRADRERQ
jgi:hypothetical protein